MQTVTATVLPQHIIAVSVEEERVVFAGSVSCRVKVLLRLVDGSRYLYADCNSMNEAKTMYDEALVGVRRKSYDLFANVEPLAPGF